MEMTKEVIEVPFEGVAVRKLHDLFERGYTVCGVAIERQGDKQGNYGAITTFGRTLWWPVGFHTNEALLKRIEDLEAQLYAVGAGGVGQSIKPPVQADTAQEPVAWRVRPFDYGIGYEGVDALTTRKEQCEIWARKGWKVEPLYTAPQPARQPLTNEQIAESEREACAALCDDIVQEEEGKLDRDYSREGTAEELAVLIRARGQQ